MSADSLGGLRHRNRFNRTTTRHCRVHHGYHSTVPFLWVFLVLCRSKRAKLHFVQRIPQLFRDTNRLSETIGTREVVAIAPPASRGCRLPYHLVSPHPRGEATSEPSSRPYDDSSHQTTHDTSINSQFPPHTATSPPHRTLKQEEKKNIHTHTHTHHATPPACHRAKRTPEGPPRRRTRAKAPTPPPE
ncbi:hypothetical protein FN846DRAFT_207695 [Sphaerosporella brunnea]|uniref:Uncharacterized protein n=1 Tax=Sphaerosporella brunnea TaxID=1250544 RepID=A0A5J5EN04_9PEZI|nr:hypothetical protein FN846DRAFT_207695 [Sphaerosporella brunnea]